VFNSRYHINYFRAVCRTIISTLSAFCQHLPLQHQTTVVTYSISTVQLFIVCHMYGSWFSSLTPKSQVVTIYTTSLTFNNSTFCPHSVFMCFVWISGQTAIIYLYSINWLVFITEIWCVYCAMRTGSMCIIDITPFKAQWSLYVRSGLTFSNSAFCPHSVFMCFVWIWEKRVIISLCSINWQVFVAETEFVYCAVRTECV